MKILVCGGRDYVDRKALFDFLDNLEHRKGPIECVIDGMARGADQLASEWATEQGVANMRFPANWDYFDQFAGTVRNRWMLSYGEPDLVIAFPGGRGTRNMVDAARVKGFEVIEALRSI